MGWGRKEKGISRRRGRQHLKPKTQGKEKGRENAKQIGESITEFKVC